MRMLGSRSVAQVRVKNITTECLPKTLSPLQRTDAGAAREEREWQEAREPPHPAVLERAALAHREVYDLKAAEAQRAAATAARAEAAERDERRARAQDYRDGLLATGQGRWRTVAEVLRDARGVPPDAG
jgi:hypothetical protein